MKALLVFVLLSGMIPTKEYQSVKRSDEVVTSLHDLEREAFRILDTKCNVCHRKKNPFMVFSLKNMKKRSRKIYRQVFVERRMPKGDEIRLTKDEYNTLEKWLSTQNLP